MSSLTGLRVVDLSRVLGGPYCTQILADHGAQVLKIEPPQGDETRMWGPPFKEDVASYFLGVNRNKDGFTLDLASEHGQQRLLELLADADVLVQNFKPGTMEKWGLGKEVLAQHFPRLVHCRVTGFGDTGPFGNWPGYDACTQALCGLMSVNGESGGEPTRVGLPVVDMVTGLNAALAIMFALNERDSSGLGQFLDITLFDCALSLQIPHAPNYFLSAKEPQRTGNAHPNIAPYESFPTADGTLFLAVGNDGQFKRLLNVIHRVDLAEDHRFQGNGQRVRNREALRTELLAAFSAANAQDLADELMAQGVPAAPVNNLSQILQHEHTAHRDMVWEQDGFKTLGTPIRLSRTPGSLRTQPPKLRTEEELEQGWSWVPRTAP